MLRYSVCIVTVLIATAATLATPIFSLPSEILIEPGQSLTVELRATGAGGVSAMDLYMAVDAPFELAAMKVHQADAGTVWVGLSPVGITGDHVSGDPWALLAGSAQKAYGFVSIQSSWSPAAEGTIVAVMTLSAPADAPLDTTGLLGTGQWPGQTSKWGSAAADGQAAATIRVVPEPATGFLLLAGLLGAIRRRVSSICL